MQYLLTQRIGGIFGLIIEKYYPAESKIDDVITICHVTTSGVIILRDKLLSKTIKKAFAVVFCLSILVSCSAYTEKGTSELHWAIDPTLSGAWPFSNHAGLISDTSSTVRLIDSGGSDLFPNLNLDLSSYTGTFPNRGGQWNINRFSAGILKNPKFELSRSGKMCEAAKTAYTIKGNPIRVGQLYIVAVQSTAGISGTYYGVVNAQKRWIEEPVFDEFELLPQGCCRLSYGGVSPYTVIINADGMISRIPGILKMTSWSAISDADADDPWYAMHNVQKENFYIDQYGEIKLKCPYSYCENFSEGLAVVMSGGKYGYINRRGEIAVKLQFEYAQPFSEGVAAVKETSDGGCMLIDTQGNVVLETDYDEIGMFKDGLAICIRNGKWGIMDRTGKEIVKSKYQFVTKFDSCYLLNQGDKYGLYLPVCSKVIRPQYLEISYSAGNCAIVRKNDKYGMLNLETGEAVIEPHYLEMGYFGEGTVYVCSWPNRYGIVANNGNIIVPADGTYRLEPDEGFGDALVPICKDDKWGYIANPLVYSAWNSNVLERASSIGMDSGTQECSCNDFMQMVFDVYQLQMDLMRNRTQFRSGPIPETCTELQQMLNASDFQGMESINRQQAAFILAQLSKQYGNITEYYINCCDDGEEVDTRYASAVAYASSLGIFDIQDNCFDPTEILDRSEAASILTLFFEEMLDTESPFAWSVDGDIIIINDLSTFTTALKSPESLSACWW